MGWLDKYDDEIIAQGGETIPLSREIPEITVYGKKNYLQELDKQQQKYLADMAKYKQDSVQWVKANKAYQDSLVSYNRNRKAKRLFDLYTNYYDSDLKGIERVGNKVSIPRNYRQASDKDILDAESGKMPLGGIGSEDPRHYVFSTNKENILLDKGITDILTTGYKIPIKPTSPIAPIKPIGTNINYDDTYENLQMRPLWATMAKQDTTSKIGTLNPLDPLYEKGFTYGEAQKFPEEIKKQYKLDYPIYVEGGNVSYTPEYINQLKRFENKPDNLAYHQDNKGIPTIGWGHRITKEELERKAIKMGKEWVPYERFSGKEGRQLADKLMEQDVSHHYTRLERQVGKDTLSTLPPEVQDVLLDITYNRGSLGDSLEYVKKGDIAGLRDYLAETSKELKGGAKTRMEWRANRIPLKTLPPVETPIYYTDKDKYVPKALQSIAEVQPSTQSIIPIQDNEGYRNQENYGKPVQITSNQSRTPISMDQVPFPILAMSDTGELKIMMPGEEHTFEGGSVTELPMVQEGTTIPKYTRDNVRELRDTLSSNYNLPIYPEEEYPNVDLDESIFSPSQNDVRDWLKARAFRFPDQLGKGNLQRQILNLASSKTVDRYRFISDLAQHSLEQAGIEMGDDTYMNNWKSSYDHFLNRLSNSAGAYNPLIHSQFSIPEISTQRHESSHASIPRPQEQKISEIITERPDKYLDSPDEIYARLMQMRLDNKFDPERIWRKNDIEYLRKLDKKKGYNLLNRYGDEGMLRLLNEVAENETGLTDTPQAENGANIKKSKQLRTFTKDLGWLSKYKEL